MNPFVWVAAVVATAGAGLGVGLGATGGVDLVRATTVLSADAVAYHDCPDGASLGDFHRGDRAYVTGRDDSGAWLEVRAPRNPSSRVWIEAHYAIPDSSTGGLPVVECDVALLAAPGEPEDQGSAAPGEDATAPGEEEDDTAAAPGAPGGGTGPAPGPSDTTPPTIGNLTASPGSIWETPESGAPSCGDTDATVTVSGVSDPSGIASVTISWSVGGKSGSKPMSGSGSYTATVGGFDYMTLPFDQMAPVSMTVTARDQVGNEASRSFGVLTLVSCGTA